MLLDGSHTRKSLWHNLVAIVGLHYHTVSEVRAAIGTMGMTDNYPSFLFVWTLMANTVIGSKGNDPHGAEKRKKKKTEEEKRPKDKGICW